MGNITSRNDHFPVPPGFMPPVYPGYPQFATPTTWNPFKRSQMKKRQKALREYLYTTPMILQYPGSFAVTQPGQTLMHSDIPQVHAAIPLAPVSANGITSQMPVPVTGAPMVVTGAGAPTYQGGAGAGGAGAAAPVIPSQMAPMNYPATFDYSAFLDPRGAADPVVPRRSRRSQRHRSHRSRRRSRSPTPSTESSASGSESPYSSPSSYDSDDYPRHRRHHRSNSGRNPLPRPPKDVLASTPFRPLLTQLPSAQYNSWGIGGARFEAQQQQQQQQQPPPPQPTTYSNIRPRRQRRGILNRNGGSQFPVPSLAAAANAIVRPFVGATMAMPEPQLVQHAPAGTARSSAAPVPPVIPRMGSPQPQMRMPSPEMTQHGPPVIPHGTPMPMPSPAPAGSTPFIGPGGLGAPTMPPPGHMIPVPVIPSPSSGHVPMPMPSPAVMPGGLTRPTTPMGAAATAVPPPGSVQVMSVMAMPSPSLGQGAAMGQQIIKFNGYGEFSGLLYHSPHSVVYQDELYPTALHLFEARKFLDHRPDLADRIRQTDQVEQVTAISAELAEFTRRDWGNVALATMDEVLYLKFRQHSELRTLLLSTYPSELMYVESGDPFWGDGAGQGLNELGNSLMRVRERLRIEVGI